MSKVICRIPTCGKKPTRIDEWKYDAVRTAILDALRTGDDGVEFRRLRHLVADRIPVDELARLGSVSWYTSSVKLDLEVKGETERVPASKPQRIRRPA